MPKPRKRKVKNGAMDPRATFVHVPTPELVVIEDMDATITNLDVAGRFVKLAPKIPASQRDSFNSSSIVDQIMAFGALAVVLAPVYLGEISKDVEKVAEARNDRDAARAWFESQKVADPTDLKAAQELVLDFMDAESM